MYCFVICYPALVCIVIDCFGLPRKDWRAAIFRTK